jgi:hypothetical protein
MVAGATTSAVAVPASMAQMKAKMVPMQASNPQGFAACQTLASSRGYRIAQPNGYESWGLMNFIDGCLMGKQHWSAVSEVRHNPLEEESHR